MEKNLKNKFESEKYNKIENEKKIFNEIDKKIENINIDLEEKNNSKQEDSLKHNELFDKLYLDVSEDLNKEKFER